MYTAQTVQETTWKTQSTIVGPGQKKAQSNWNQARKKYETGRNGEHLLAVPQTSHGLTGVTVNKWIIYISKKDLQFFTERV